MADNNAKINKLLGERGSFNKYTKVSSIDEATELWNKLKSQNSFNKDQIKIIDENIERLNTARRKITNYGQKCEPYIKDPVTQAKFDDLRGADRQYKKASIAALSDLTNGEVKAPMSLTFDGRKLSSNLADLGGLEYTSFLKNSLTLAAACTLFTPALSGLASYFAEGNFLNYLAGGSGAFLSKVLGSFLPEVLGGILGTLTSVLNPATAGIALVVGVGSLAFLARKVLGPEIKKFKDKSKVKSLAKDLFAKEFGKEDAKESYEKSQKFKKDSSKNFEKELFGLCKNGVPDQKDIDSLKAKYISIGASEEELNTILKAYVGDPQRSQNDMGKYFSKDDKGNYNYKADIKGYLVAHPDVFKRYNDVVQKYKTAISTICNTSKLPTDKGTALRNLETSCKDLFPSGPSLPVELELQTLCNGLHTVTSNLYTTYATSSSLNGKKEADIKNEVEQSYGLNDTMLDEFNSSVETKVSDVKASAPDKIKRIEQICASLDDVTKRLTDEPDGTIRKITNNIINIYTTNDTKIHTQEAILFMTSGHFDKKQAEFYIKQIETIAKDLPLQLLDSDQKKTMKDALESIKKANGALGRLKTESLKLEDAKNNKATDKTAYDEGVKEAQKFIGERNAQIKTVLSELDNFVEKYIRSDDKDKPAGPGVTTKDSSDRAKLLKGFRDQLKDPKIAKTPDLAPLVKKIEEYINELESAGKKYAYSDNKRTQSSRVKAVKTHLEDKFKEFDADGNEIDFIEGIKQQLS